MLSISHLFQTSKPTPTIKPPPVNKTDSHYQKVAVVAASSFILIATAYLIFARSRSSQKPGEKSEASQPNSYVKESPRIELSEGNRPPLSSRSEWDSLNEPTPRGDQSASNLVPRLPLKHPGQVASSEPGELPPNFDGFDSSRSTFWVETPKPLSTHRSAVSEDRLNRLSVTQQGQKNPQKNCVMS